ncbi:MAG: hypothetical protein HC851_10705 [Acaryochloris sp. RU_4_1]|nr:hypothetical protein [Acaryochloris sp. RU_4_1]
MTQRIRVSDQGFALPAILGMGLLMLMIATTLIIKAQGDQTTAIAQRDTAETLALAEGGSSRTLGMLNSNYQSFLILNYDPNNLLPPNTGAPNQWSTPPEPPPCFDASQLDTILLNGRIPTTVAANTYTVEAYRYDTTTQTGTLLVKGYPPNSTAFARVQQTFNVSSIPSLDPANFPGLYGDRVNLGNNDVLGAIGGNVFCKNCLLANTATQCINGQPTQGGLRAAIGALNNGVVQGQIRLGKISLPRLPTAPTGAIPLGNFSGNGVQLPGLRDQPISIDSGVPTYSYALDSLTMSGNNIMRVNTTNARINFYVRGNITMSGNSQIKNVCTGCTSYGGTNLGNPARFSIYGKPDDGDTSYDQEFTLNGGATPSNVFIYAPDARMGINGGSSSPDIYGAVWVKEWNGSNSNNADISVPNNMRSLLRLEGFNVDNLITVYRTSANTRWQRRSQEP